MGWELRDAGLAAPWWRGYLSPAEAAELAGVARTTMLVAGGQPVHVRVLTHDQPSPVVVMAHGLLTYGLVLAGLQLRLHRLGCTVVQVDLPGFGQSGGARGQATGEQVRQALTATVDFARERAEGPLHLLGLGEECLIVYEAMSRPGVASGSLHTVFDGTDPQLGHPPMRAGTLGGGDSAAFSPAAALAFPADADAEARAALTADPLAVREISPALVSSLQTPVAGTPPLEASPVPIQVIASERSALWSYEAAVHSFTRLRSPKDLVTLPDAYDWSLRPDFLDTYAANVARWFRRHASAPAMDAVQAAETIVAMPALANAETIPAMPALGGVGAPSETQILTSLPLRPAARLRAAEPGGQPAAPFVLPDGPVTIGRAPAHPLVLGHSTVSHHHARIDWSGLEYQIADLGSANGTFVNERRVPPAPEHHVVASGDRVRLGAVTMIFELAQPN